MKYPKDLDRSLAGLVARIPKRFTPIMIFASTIATPVAIGIIFACLIICSLVTSNDQLLKAALVGLVLSPIAEISKYITKRRRPVTLYAKRMRFKTYSFPSGHSYISVLVFGFLAILAFMTLPYGTLVALLLSVLIFTVGLSRVYLGAHFPSDVLAGWALGFTVLMIWVQVGL